MRRRQLEGSRKRVLAGSERARAVKFGGTDEQVRRGVSVRIDRDGVVSPSGESAQGPHDDVNRRWSRRGVVAGAIASTSSRTPKPSTGDALNSQEEGWVHQRWSQRAAA